MLSPSKLPLPEVLTSLLQPERVGKIAAEIVGIGKDFWKDTPPAHRSQIAQKRQEEKAEKKRAEKQKTEEARAQKERFQQPSKDPKKWRADRIDILEKMWGKGAILPGGPELVEKLVAPLGLNGSMNVLDLSAGLGGLARKLATDYDAYVTGLEVDPELALRGRALSIDAGKSKQADVEVYDPLTFKPARHYDCIIARELFYRVVGKAKFFKAVSSGLKSHGQISFTDYILEPEQREIEAIATWLSFEKKATPLGLVETRQTWMKMNFDVRVNEDLTDFYIKEIKHALARFTASLAVMPPDEVTKPLIYREIMLWSYRAAALEKGLKFCRFYAMKI